MWGCGTPLLPDPEACRGASELNSGLGSPALSLIFLTCEVGVIAGEEEGREWV